MEASNQEKPHVAIMPSPGMGHLIPFIELAKRLIHLHNFSVTFIIPTDHHSSSKDQQIKFLDSISNQIKLKFISLNEPEFLKSSSDYINYIFLPPVNVDDLPKDVTLTTRLAISMVRSSSALRDTLKVIKESANLVVLMVDLFGVLIFDVGKELGIPSYMFTTNAMFLTLMLHMPKIDETFTCEYKDLLEPVKLPGCVALHGKDLYSVIQDRKNDSYKCILEMCKKFNMVDGILLNSFLDLEPGAFEALTQGGWCKPPVYSVGPLVQSGSTNEKGERLACLKWLDKQPNRSVLFVSFGSGGTLSHDQLNELAFGLEMSGQRFIWVVKSPHNNDANAAYFDLKSSDDPFNFLPKGFLDNTKDRGLLVPTWAPQIQILSHGSTGGFLTHCGWNSTLESIMHSVPLIAWPLYAEQSMNKVLLGDDLKVALKVEKNENGLVTKDQIAKLAKNLMGEEGKQLHDKMRDLNSAAVKAIDIDGSSTKSLALVARKWTSEKGTFH